MTKQLLANALSAIGGLAVAAMAVGLAGCAADSGPGSARAVPLEQTHWKLVEIKGASVSPGAGRRGPHIAFDPEKKRVTGYGGVNNFFGGYEMSGEALRMPRLASTRRAGPPELMELESTFLTALAATASYRITGDKLELLDSSGRALARFQAQQIR